MREAKALHRLRDIRPGQDKRPARKDDDPFVRAAGGVGREVGGNLRRHVAANDGEVAGVEFENVRAAFEAARLGAVRMGLGAKSALDHGRSILPSGIVVK